MGFSQMQSEVVPLNPIPPETVRLLENFSMSIMAVSVGLFSLENVKFLQSTSPRLVLTRNHVVHLSRIVLCSSVRKGAFINEIYFCSLVN